MNRYENRKISYGTCDVWCEFVLAFRSLATVTAFFLSSDRRRELKSFGTSCRRFYARIKDGMRACCGTAAVNKSSVTFDDSRIEQVRFIETTGETVLDVQCFELQKVNDSSHAYRLYFKTSTHCR